MIVGLLLTLVVLVVAIGGYVANLKRLGVRTKSLDWVIATITLATLASAFFGAIVAGYMMTRAPNEVAAAIMSGLFAAVFGWPLAFIVALVPTKLYQVAGETQTVRVLGCGKHGPESGATPEESSALLPAPEDAQPLNDCRLEAGAPHAADEAGAGVFTGGNAKKEALR